MKLAPKAAEAALRNILITKIANPVAEAVAEEWVEVYCELVLRRMKPSSKVWRRNSVFHERIFRLGMKTAPAPFGIDKSLNFWIHIRALYSMLRAGF